MGFDEEGCDVFDLVFCGYEYEGGVRCDTRTREI